jgi:hypothetical protein
VLDEKTQDGGEFGNDTIVFGFEQDANGAYNWDSQGCCALPALCFIDQDACCRAFDSQHDRL